jgi:hypothetical protein
MELMDRTAVDCVREVADLSLPDEAGCALLIEVDGHQASVEQEADRVEDGDDSGRTGDRSFGGPEATVKINRTSWFPAALEMFALWILPKEANRELHPSMIFRDGRDEAPRGEAMGSWVDDRDRSFASRNGSRGRLMFADPN